MSMLSALIVVPIIGAVGAAALGRVNPKYPRWAALLTALCETALSAAVVTRFVADDFVALTDRILDSTSFWSLVADGLSIPLVALTAVLSVVAVLASWEIEDAPGAHHALLLLLTTATVGVFLAEDLILFYVFWEAVLIPMFFLIGKWGHERRRHAAMKFFLYTFLGSALMLVALILITLNGGRSISALVVGTLTPELQQWVFWLLAAGFLVKIPVWPLHTWLPDAHVEAPTAGSIMLAGVLLKMGGYGMLRLAMPVAPQAYEGATGILATLGIVGIVYGAFTAMAQSDLKRLVAYSSVAHMGFVVLAISVGTPLAVGAAMLGMISHGVISGLLFLLVGLLYERAHTREISRFGGLFKAVPSWGTAFAFAALASLGLPGLSGFPGELLTILEAYGPYGWWLVAAMVGIVVSAAFHLWAVKRVNHGPLAAEWEGLADLTLRERLAIAPLVAAIFLLGVWPQVVLAMTEKPAQAIAFFVGRGF